MLSICAIVVTYYPNYKILLELLHRIKNQVGHIIIVANSSFDEDISQEIPATKFDIIALSENIGLAAAHNRGAVRAKEYGFNYVLLLDQDSLPAENMVAELLQADLKLRSLNRKVAVIGPRYIDIRNNVAADFIRFENGKTICATADENNFFSTHHLITSGSLIKLDVFDEIGLYDESLFIDNVDSEWAFRAIDKNYECIGNGSAILYHRLGDTPVNIGGQIYFTHSPLRHYYIFRNRILLYKRKYVLKCWKKSDIPNLLPKLILHTVYTPPRWQHFRMIMLGVWHGLINKSGKLKEKKKCARV